MNKRKFIIIAAALLCCFAAVFAWQTVNTSQKKAEGEKEYVPVKQLNTGTPRSSDGRPYYE